MSGTLEAVGSTTFHIGISFIYSKIFKMRPTYRRLTRSLKNILEAMWKEAVEQ